MTITVCFMLLSCLIKSVSPTVQDVGSDESRLVAFIEEQLADRSLTTRPVKNSSHPIHIELGISLIQIVEFDVKNNRIELLMWKRYLWTHEYLSWNPADFGGLDEVTLPSRIVWLPDIVLYNNIKERHPDDDGKNIRIHLKSTGFVEWTPPVTHHSSCPVDMEFYPFDEQTCVLTFGSWAYDSSKLDLCLVDNLEQFDVTEYVPSSGWDILVNNATQVYAQYPCCPSPFAELHFSLTLRRKVTFHMRLVLVPSVILSLLVIAIFFIPPNRPDRSAFGLTLFSGFLLILILVVNSSPATANSWLGEYLLVVIIIITLSVLCSMITINIAHANRDMPEFLEKVITGSLGCLLCIQIPKKMIFWKNANKSEEIKSVPINKWLALAEIIDRIMFLLFFPALIICFIFVFPKPKKLFYL